MSISNVSQETEFFTGPYNDGEIAPEFQNHFRRARGTHTIPVVDVWPLVHSREKRVVVINSKTSKNSEVSLNNLTTIIKKANNSGCTVL